MLEWIFWGSLAGIAYTTLGYPALLWVCARLAPRPVRKGAELHSVSVIIAAHNEAGVILQKLESCVSLDYPADRLEILIGTDGCTDPTDDRISEFLSSRAAGSRPVIRHFRFNGRMGKPATLNQLVPAAQGEILIFTDARQRVAPDAARRLVEDFADPVVGAVSGELILVRNGGGWNSFGHGIGAYWDYEKFIRQKESQVGSVVGVTGALYALRRRLYRPLDPQTILDDVEVPLQVISQGYRVAFESSALVFDQAARGGQEEFRRKVRTLTGNYQVFSRYPHLLLPGSPIGWQFWSHKLLRTVVPLWLACIFLSSLWLPGPFYRAAVVGQVIFYGMAALGWGPAYLFCLLNLSTVVGLYRFLRGNQPVTWEKTHAS